MGKNNESNSLKPMLLGIIYGCIASFSSLIVFAFILTVVDLSNDIAVHLATAAIIIGAFVSGYSSAFLNKARGLIIGATTGLAYYILLSIIAVAITKTGLSMLFVIRLAAVAIISSIGGIIGLNKGLKRRDI